METSRDFGLNTPAFPTAEALICHSEKLYLLEADAFVLGC